MGKGENRYKIFILLNQNNSDLSLFDLDRSYSKEDAIEIIKKLRKQKVVAEIYPEAYAASELTREQAFFIALTAYEKEQKNKPGNYGELQAGVEKPVYYSFYCRDFEAEEAGCVPGRWVIFVDKLSGEIMPYAKVREFLFLNDSF